MLIRLALLLAFGCSCATALQPGVAFRAAARPCVSAASCAGADAARLSLRASRAGQIEMAVPKKRKSRMKTRSAKAKVRLPARCSFRHLLDPPHQPLPSPSRLTPSFARSGSPRRGGRCSSPGRAPSPPSTTRSRTPSTPSARRPRTTTMTRLLRPGAAYPDALNRAGLESRTRCARARGAAGGGGEGEGKGGGEGGCGVCRMDVGMSCGCRDDTRDTRLESGEVTSRLLSRPLGRCGVEWTG